MISALIIGLLGTVFFWLASRQLLPELRQQTTASELEEAAA
jgi:hypothetical protein